MTRLETPKSTWFLEVVRGRDVGRRFPVPASSSVLGAGPGSEAGIDLTGQETGTLKRMSPRQARLDLVSDRLSILDLESPGGTFVNRKRLLSGSAQALSEGDVIQVGGVQLRVTRGSEATLSPAPPPAPVAGAVYALPSGETCRTFDDVLSLSAQRWNALRDELTSGRLSAHLARNGRANLAPDPNAPGSPDERLDAWLRSLPTTKPCRPELDLNPVRVVVRNPSGGVVRRPVRVSNTGYGVLTYRVNVDPSSRPWLRVAGGEGQSRSVVEGGEFVLEIDLPDDLALRRTGACVVESDGGQARVSIEIEPARPTNSPPDAAPLDHPGAALGPGLASWSLSKRMATFVSVLLIARLLVTISTWALARNDPEPSPLWPSSAVFAGLGLLVGPWCCRRDCSLVDRFAVGFSSLVMGLMASALVVAVARSLEPFLPGSGLVHAALVMAMWLAIGLGVAWGSSRWIPVREQGR